MIGKQPPAPRPQGTRAAQGRRDLKLALTALGLLAACGALWLWLATDARQRREATLSGLPAFPAPGQVEVQRPRRVSSSPKPAPPPQPVAAPAPKVPGKADPMTSFVLSNAHSAALIQVNALVNTPLFARLKECLPMRFSEMDDQMKKVGIDFERDIDRVAMVEGGVAMSGFFEGKPIARTISSRWSGDVREDSYRGAQIFSGPRQSIAQVGNLVVFGSSDTIRETLDRALDPPADAERAEQVYGDLYVRSDLSSLGGGQPSPASGSRDALEAVLQSLKGVTVRANVWDSVALSVEGTPRDGQSTVDLARMAQGAISLVRQNLDHDDVELSALAELAKVDSDKQALKVDLALPANDLFDKLHFPCPGKDGELGARGGAPFRGAPGGAAAQPPAAQTPPADPPATPSPAAQ